MSQIQTAAAIVGVDGGGTKTRAVAKASFDTLHEGLSGPCNIAFMPVSDALASVVDSVAQTGAIANDVRAICVAVAGYSFNQRRTEMLSCLKSAYPKAKVSLVPDFEAAFWNAHPNGTGIHTIAGTGSVSYGQIEADVKLSHRAGGYGYLIDDSGSGYGVGRAAIASVLHAIDGTGSQTSLTKAVPAALGLAESSWDDLIAAIYGGIADRVTIAGLATVVADAGSDGDEVASRILHRAGGALARLVEAVFNKLNCTDRPLQMSRSGSLWNAGSALTDVFERSVMRFAPNAEIGAVGTVDAAVGALEIARRL